MKLNYFLLSVRFSDRLCQEIHYRRKHSSTKRNQRIRKGARACPAIRGREDKEERSCSCEFSGSLGGTFIVIPNASSIVRHRQRRMLLSAQNCQAGRRWFIDGTLRKPGRYHRAEPIKRLARGKERKARSATLSTPRFRKWMADETFSAIAAPINNSFGRLVFFFPYRPN